MLDGIALGKTFTADVWATQRGECVPLLKHFWRAWGTRRAYLTCSGARSSRQQGTVVRRRNSAASTRRNVVCDRGMCREAQPSHFAAKLSCKTSLQRCTIGRSLQSHTAAAVEGAEPLGRLCNGYKPQSVQSPVDPPKTRALKGHVSFTEIALGGHLVTVTCTPIYLPLRPAHRKPTARAWEFYRKLVLYA